MPPYLTAKPKLIEAPNVGMQVDVYQSFLKKLILS